MITDPFSVLRRPSSVLRSPSNALRSQSYNIHKNCQMPSVLCRPSSVLVVVLMFTDPLRTPGALCKPKVTLNKVEALNVLYKQLSSSIVHYGLINKLTLLGNYKQHNLFVDRDYEEMILAKW